MGQQRIEPSAVIDATALNPYSCLIVRRTAASCTSNQAKRMLVVAVTTTLQSQRRISY